MTTDVNLETARCDLRADTDASLKQVTKRKALPTDASLKQVTKREKALPTNASLKQVTKREALPTDACRLVDVVNETRNVVILFFANHIIVSLMTESI